MARPARAGDPPVAALGLLVWSGVDIRTKLIFALVAVSLGSMFALGAVVSPRIEGYIRDGTLQQLDRIADAKLEGLGLILNGWREGTDLVASRTQLRASLAEYARGARPESAARVETILMDALDALRTGTLLEVLDADGQSVARVERGGSVPVEFDMSVAPPGETRYAGVTLPQSGPPQVTLLAAMILDGSSIGTLVVVREAPELIELTEQRRGLGETGETLILAEDGDGMLRTLHPTRHDPARSGVLLPSGPTSLGARAVRGDPLSLAGDVFDYRGEEVWAATRRFDETGWGLVVKIDRAEAARPATESNAWARRTAVILSAFAIVVGLVLGLRFAQPIHALAEVASRIRHGEMDARANALREDEVGLLARTFNDMADELERRLARLGEFRKFFDVTINLMCIAGTDGYFRLTNPAFERELGWSQEELCEHPFFHFVHPDDIERTEQEVARLAEGIPTISFENRYLCKDGSYKRLRWTSYPEGGVLYAIAHVIGPAAG